MDTNIKVIIFDLGKVIVNFDHMRICNNLSIYSTLKPAWIYDLIFSSGLEASFDKGTISPENFYLQVKKVLESNIEKDKFRGIWTQIFTLNTGIEELISSLKDRHKLFCLSNTNKWHFEHCMEEFQVLKHFDKSRQIK